MATFAKVVDLNGFSAAARAFKVPKAAVSRAVAELELELGALVDRLRAGRLSEWLLLGSCLLLFLLGLALGRGVTRSVTEAVETARASAVRIANGDLTLAPAATSRSTAPSWPESSRRPTNSSSIRPLQAPSARNA